MTDFGPFEPKLRESAVQTAAKALQYAEWGQLKGPMEVPGMWEHLARTAIEAYKKSIDDESKPPFRKCANCGHAIQQLEYRWTHADDWQGKRCPRKLTGATPVKPEHQCCWFHTYDLDGIGMKCVPRPEED